MTGGVLRRVRDRVGPTVSQSIQVLFGDRCGLILFVGATVFFGLFWRVDFFITDNLTIANTLVNVADGHLYFDELVYQPPSDETPGMSVVDGWLYGRNYGHVFLALPVLWLLDALATVADPSTAIAGAWSLAILALFDQIGAETDRRERLAGVGVVLSTIAFAANVAILRPIDPRWFPMMALQLFTIVAAALVPVVLYRLLDSMHDRRTGLFAGAAAVLATPVAIWATVPKRHTITALLALLAVYSFYVSRSTSSNRTALRARALSYVWAGLTAWVHAPEGVVLLVAVATVDVTTARSNHWTHLLVIGTVFVVSLLPLFVTNQLIAGNPLAVPRMLPSYGGQETIVALEGSLDPASGDPGAGTGGQSDAGQERGEGGLQGQWSSSNPLIGITQAVVGLLVIFAAQLLEGLSELSQPQELIQTFVRRGNPAYWRGGGRAINLSVLESMPLAALLVSVPLARYGDRKRNGRRHGLAGVLDGSITPNRATDVLVVAYLSILLLVYAPRLPVRASITVRYLHPMYPLLVYLVARQSVVRGVLAERRELLAWSYAASVLIGGQILAVVLIRTATTPGEAIQFHGLLALGAATLLLGWSTLARLRSGYERTGAVLLAVTGAVTTLYLLFSIYLYFGFMGRHAIPVSRIVSEVLTLG